MSFIIYKMEMLRNLKSFLIWSLSICAILFFGMLFYPAINADGLLTQMEVLFENPMMKGVLAAFGADVSALGSLMGFYVTYNSIYNVLLGCIFASILAGNLLAREEAGKTAEFLLTRPVSRKTIFRSKSAVLFTYLTLLSVLFFLFSLFSLEFVQNGSPRQLDLSLREKNVLINQIKRYPGEIYEAFNLTENSFAEYSLTYASTLLAGNRREIEEMNLNPDEMNRLINLAIADPEGFFQSVLETPEDYMPLFSIPPEGREKFLAQVRGEEEQFREMRESFFTSPEVFLMIFEADPSIALNRFAGLRGSMAGAIELLDLPEDFEQEIFSTYSVGKLFILCVYIYLLILSIGCFILCISLSVKRGKSVLGLALGLVFFFYFLNSLVKMAGSFSSLVHFLGYISPFAWMDTDVYAPGFGLVWWRILYFILVSFISLTVAEKSFKQKDILV
jgi:ABC-type transport system involved in multi-copper enzyme maturation permease subunit